MQNAITVKNCKKYMIFTLTDTCSACHKISILQQITRLQSDITKPHRQDLCEMCKSLNRYCGR